MDGVRIGIGEGMKMREGIKAATWCRDSQGGGACVGGGHDQGSREVLATTS